MTSGDVSRSRSTQVRRRPETFFLVTRDKDVNQDQSRINSAEHVCDHGRGSRPAFAPASLSVFLYWCSELIFVQTVFQQSSLPKNIERFLFKIFFYK